MDTELAHRLDRSIGSAPEDADPLAGLLAEGHRSVRRRRVAVTAAAAAAVAAIAGGTTLATGGDSGRAGPPVADSPSATPSPKAATPSPTPAPTPAMTPAPTPAMTPAPTPTATPPSIPAPTPTAPQRWPWPGELAALDFGTHEVEVHPGATVLRRLDNPFHLDPPRGSEALELTRHGKTYWYAFAWDKSGSSMAASPARGSFESWVRDMSTIAATDEVGASQPVPADAPGRPEDALVLFAADHGELLVPFNGVVVLDHREGVDLGPSFATEEDDTAAAEVRAPDGTVSYVLARRTAGEPAQYIAVPKAKGGADLDAFLDFARQRYAEGSGLL